MITITHIPPKKGTTAEASAANVCKILEDAGATVVGINCMRGLQTALPVIKEIRRTCKVGTSWFTEIFVMHV